MSPDVAKARTEALVARQRLSATADTLLHRVAPDRLFQDGASALRARASALGDEAAGTIRRRPGTTVAVAAGVALFLARHRIAAALTRRVQPARRRRVTSHDSE